MLRSVQCVNDWKLLWKNCRRAYRQLLFTCDKEQMGKRISGVSLWLDFKHGESCISIGFQKSLPIKQFILRSACQGDSVPRDPLPEGWWWDSLCRPDQSRWNHSWHQGGENRIVKMDILEPVGSPRWTKVWKTCLVLREREPPRSENQSALDS